VTLFSSTFPLRFVFPCLNNVGLEIQYNFCFGLVVDFLREFFLNTIEEYLSFRHK
jgi:hypothetical protein